MTYISPAARRAAAASGKAMPGGRYPIRNLEDLKNAKQAIGRSSTPEATRAFINKRAKALGAAPIGARAKARRRVKGALRQLR